VQLTRTTNLRVPLRTRAEIAEALEPELFISIHHNGGAVRRQSTPGIEAYYQHNSAQAKRAGGILYEELKASFSRYNVAWVGTSKGVTSRLRSPGSDLYGIHRYTPNIPSVITEAGYLSNYSEAVNLARPSVQQAEAQAIADGVLRWLSTSDSGSGFTPHFTDPNSTGTGGTDNCTDPVL
jgi:N-acetylmuramoyl-L-alanine amidase